MSEIIKGIGDFLATVDRSLALENYESSINREDVSPTDTNSKLIAGIKKSRILEPHTTIANNLTTEIQDSYDTKTDPNKSHFFEEMYGDSGELTNLLTALPSLDTKDLNSLQVHQFENVEKNHSPQKLEIIEMYKSNGFDQDRAVLAAETAIKVRMKEAVATILELQKELSQLEELNGGFSEEQEKYLVAKFNKTSAQHCEAIGIYKEKIVKIQLEIQKLQFEKNNKVREHAQPRIKEIDIEIRKLNEKIIKFSNAIVRYPKRLQSLLSDNFRKIRYLHNEIDSAKIKTIGFEQEFDQAFKPIENKEYENN